MLLAPRLHFCILVIILNLPGILSAPRWRWLPKPHLPLEQPTLDNYTASDLNPVAFPAASSGKLKKGPLDLKKLYDFPIFSLAPEDEHDHGATVFSERGGCMRNTMARINGVPQAVQEMTTRRDVAQGGHTINAQGARGKPGQTDGNLMWDPAADDLTGKRRENWQPSTPEELRDVVLKAGMAGHAYGNILQPAVGKSSACIDIDILGQGAEHVLLWRWSSRVPRTAAAMWLSEGCVGEVDTWVTQGLGDERVCGRRKRGGKGTWRSMRVWYGSERLGEDQFGEGRISLTQKANEYWAVG